MSKTADDYWSELKSLDTMYSEAVNQYKAAEVSCKRLKAQREKLCQEMAQNLIPADKTQITFVLDGARVLTVAKLDKQADAAAAEGVKA